MTTMSMLENIVAASQTDLPELGRLELKIGNRAVTWDDYERINAMLVSRNIANNENENILLIHPSDDDVAILAAIIAGLAMYKSTSQGVPTEGYKISDFSSGELVEYKGEVRIFARCEFDRVYKKEMVWLEYADKEKSWFIVTVPEFLENVRKYSGGRQEPEKIGRGNERWKVAIATVLGVSGESIGLSGHDSVVIVSDKLSLLDRLKQTTVRGVPFCEVFPSANYSGQKLKRLCVDKKRRPYFFYFVSSLLSADELMRLRPGIKTMIIDGEKKISSSNLLATIRHDYDLEDIFALQTYEGLDQLGNLMRILQTKLWLWRQNDFAELKKVGVAKRIAGTENLEILLPYPDGVDIETHESLRRPLLRLRHYNLTLHSPELNDFLRSAFGVLIRIFNSPMPLSVLDAHYIKNGKLSCADEISRLESVAEELAQSTLPADLTAEIRAWFGLAKSSAQAFGNLEKKIQELITVISGHRRERVGIIVRKAFFSDLLDARVRPAVNSTYELSNFKVITEAEIKNERFDVLIWTFMPSVRPGLLFDQAARKNYFLLYGHQLHSFNKYRETFLGKVDALSTSEHRASVLHLKSTEAENETSGVTAKIPGEADRAGGSGKGTAEGEDDEMLFLDLATHPMAGPANSAAGVAARRIIFRDGSVAYFRPGAHVRVLDASTNTVELVPLDWVGPGDRVVFFKDSKNTLFDELASYYEHQPAVVGKIHLSELWRKALLSYLPTIGSDASKLRDVLEKNGLKRGIQTVENWLGGQVICPPENEYEAIDIIVKITNDQELLENRDSVKEACKQIRSMRLKIGRYIAGRLTKKHQGASLISDPSLRNKLDEVVKHTEVAEALALGNELMEVDISNLNKLIHADADI